MTPRDRITSVLQGKTPDCHPFLDRMEIWFDSSRQTEDVPEIYSAMSLNDIHKTVGMGRQKFSTPYALKLNDVEVVYAFEDTIISRESDPILESFSALWAPPEISRVKAGSTRIEYITPVGKVGLKYAVDESTISFGGIEPYLTEHLIKEDADYRTAEYIIERAEVVPRFDIIAADEQDLGEHGFAVPFIHRIPFQQALLEYLGEIPLFTALYENRQRLDRLIALLDEQLTEILQRLSDLPSIYVEFGDNLDGMMTNPKLFEKYSLPHYQKYADILHGQGKKVGSHTDGNLKPLVSLLAECGLDVCESFSPAPLTECIFEEAWQAWQNGPIIWGGIPSPLLEARTNEKEFHDYIQRLLEIVGNQPIIFGIGDMVLGNNLIERIEYIASEIENYRLI